MNKLAGLLKQKLIDPILALLKQGVTPEKIALSLSLGTTIACIPMIGLTTVLCAVVAQVFRLNHVAIQVANYAAYPLQIALLIPFFRMGEKLFDVPPASLDIKVMLEHFGSDFMGALALYGMTGVRGAVAWLLVAPVAAYVLNYVFRFILLKAQSRRRPE